MFLGVGATVTLQALSYMRDRDVDAARLRGATAATVRVTALDAMRWAPRNAHVLNALVGNASVDALAAWGGGSAVVISDDAEGSEGGDCRPYATFDWDNTCAFFDLQENTLMCSIDDLDFRLTPAAFRALLLQGVDVDHPACAPPQEGCVAPADIRAAASALGDAYAALHAAYTGFAATGGGGDGLSLEEAKAMPEWRDFGALLTWLYAAIEETYTPEVGYPWVLTFGGNRTVAEYTSMVDGCVRRAMGAQLVKRTFTDATHGGQYSATLRHGLRTIPEMANLFHTLQANGIDVYVVSASMEAAVAAFAAQPDFAYALQRDHVFGMRLAEHDGVIGTTYDSSWVVTYRAGKVQAIRRAIASRDEHCGRGPVLVGGDSNTDFEMLTTFPETALRIVFNRMETGDIEQLTKRAVDEVPEAQPGVIMQGRDENVGALRPDTSSILLGDSTPQLLPATR